MIDSIVIIYLFGLFGILVYTHLKLMSRNYEPDIKIRRKQLIITILWNLATDCVMINVADWAWWSLFIAFFIAIIISMITFAIADKLRYKKRHSKRW